MIEVVEAAVVGAVIGAVAALAAVYFAHRLAESSREKTRGAEREKQEKAAAKERDEALREREREALGKVVFMAYDQRVISNTALRDFPQYGNEKVGELRDEILRAQGALPERSAAHPILMSTQDVAGDLRDAYRKLQRPIGAPEPVLVSVVDFGPVVDDFRDRFGPLLDRIEELVGPSSPKFHGRTP
jgi:gas vesicle protein